MEGNLKLPLEYLTAITESESSVARLRMAGIDIRSLVVPHVFRISLYGYTKRLDSERTYESKLMFDSFATMVHFAGSRMESIWERVRARRPRP